MLRFLARFIAVVLAVLFVVATLAMVFLHPIGTRMLSSQTYKDVVRGQRLAERLPELASDAVGRAVQATRKSVERDSPDAPADFGGLLAALSPAELQALFGAALPAEYVRGQADAALDQFFGYLHSRGTRPSVVLSFVELKQRLTGGALEEAYLGVLRGKPPCAGELKTPLPVDCLPSSDQLPAVRKAFRETVARGTEGVPDTVDLFAVRPGSEATGEKVALALDIVRTRVRLLGTIARWGWVLPGALLFGIALFGVRSLRGLLLWWGVPCLVAGAVAALFAMPGATMGSWFFHGFVAPKLPPEAPVLLVEAVLGLITAVVRVVTGEVLKTAGFLALGGLVAVVLAAVVKPRPQPPALP